ncbi:MAG: hypothetical protein LBC98_03530 [Prevotellaceae bacterium]|jgi:hypothetical protein|nr:hypothetical protein [Prevotellaceae bacterium]
MATSKNNVVTFGLSGKVGDLLVFRQLDGQTIVSKSPVQSGKVSPKQKAQRERFQEAIIYAKDAIANPEFAELYAAAAKKGKRPYNIAVADFLNAPDISEIDLSAYHGAIGDTIRIKASDDFAVKEVTVVIVDDSGETLEEGAAEHKIGNQWIYTAMNEINDLANKRIVVSASDIPGNITREEKTIG